jgi:hypothetical protein
VRPIVLNPVPVALLTWSVVVLEFALAAGLVVGKRYWRALLWGGIALHAGIIVLHGLVSFGFAMIAALILYLRPIGQPWVLAATTSRWLRRRSVATPERGALVTADA